MSLEDTDLFLVENNGQTETITFAQLKDGSVLNDSDKFLVNNGVLTETVQWSEIKGEIAPDLEATATIAPTLVAPSVPMTCVANAFGGKAPYTFAYQWQSNDTDWEDITGETASEYVVATVMVGRTLRCQVTVTDDAGTEIVVLSNVSDPVEAGAVAPEIGSVSLVENNPDEDFRFTDQSFVASVSMTEDGQPASIKKFDAYVEGSITEIGQFSAVLESSAEGFNYSDITTTSNGVAPYWEGGNQVPANIFNGEGFDSNTLNANELCTTGAAGSNIFFHLPDGATLWSGKVVIACTTNNVTATLRYNTGSGYENQPDPTITQFASNNYRYTWENVTRADELLLVQVGGKVSARGIKVNDVLLVDSNYNLTFPAGTDTKFLAAGDTVQQAPQQFNEPLESSSTASGTVYSDAASVVIPTGGTQLGEPANAFDGEASTFYGVGFGSNGGAGSQIVLDFTGFPGGGLQVQNRVKLFWAANGDGMPQGAYSISLNGGDNAVSPGGNNLENQLGFSGLLETIAIKANSQVTMTYGGMTLSRFSVDDVVLIDEPNVTTLTFATGTEMSALADGDEVQQLSPTGGNYITTADPSDRINDVENLTDGKAETFADATYAVTPTLQTGESVDIFIRPDGSAWDYTGQVRVWYNITAGLWTMTAHYENGTTQTFETNQGNTGHRASILNTTTNKIKFIRLNPTNINSRIQVAGIQRFDNDEWFGNDGSGPVTYTGTVSSVADTTVTLTEAVPGWVDGIDVLGPLKSTSATVDAINNNVVSISSSTGTWVDGVEVFGPEKTITNDNTRKYLAFNSAGTVTDLLDAPQDPAYETQAADPTLTLTFPSTFPSGNTPDDEIGEGAELCVSVTATNLTGDSGPVTECVQPQVITGPNLSGLTTLYLGNGVETEVTTGINLVNNDGLVWLRVRGSGSAQYQLIDTDRGAPTRLESSSNTYEQNIPAGLFEFTTTGFKVGSDSSYNGPCVAWTFQKYANYFDIVNYTGNGQTSQTLPHELAEKPGFMFIKSRAEQESWTVYSSVQGATTFGVLDTNNGWNPNTNRFNDTEPTDTEFTIGSFINEDGKTYAAYLFGNNDEFVKHTSYTGNGGTLNVTLPFKPQFLMIKRPTVNNDWYVVDLKRPGKILKWNENTFIEADETNITLTETGFRVSGLTYNFSNTKYNYMAIAAPVTRSLTEAELAEQRLKFATYANRRDVKQGEEAMAKREALLKELEAAGLDASEVLETKAKRGRRKKAD